MSDEQPISPGASPDFLEWLEVLFGRTEDIVLLLERGESVSWVNKTGCRILLLDREEIKDRSLFDFLKPPLVEGLREFLQRYIGSHQDRNDQVPANLFLSGDDDLTLLWRAHPLDPGPKGKDLLILHGLDAGQWREQEKLYARRIIEIEKKNEERSLDLQWLNERMLESLKFFDTLINTIPNPVFYKDENLIYQGRNKAFEALMDLPEREIIGKTVFDLAPGDLAEKYHRRDLELLENPERQVYEAQVQQAGKGLRNVIFYKAVIPKPGGGIGGILGIIIDITERVTIQKELMRNRDFLDSIYRGVDMAIFVVDVDDHDEFRYAGLNATHERLTGLRSENIGGKRPEDLIPAIPADVVEGIRRNYEACRVSAAVYAYEEMVPFEGSETWWLTRLSPLVDEAGRVYRIIGTSTDITEKKRSELKLIKTAEELKGKEAFIHSLVEAIPNPIYYRDHEGRYLGCNRAFEEYLGISRVELVKRSAGEWTPCDSIAACRDHDDLVLRSKSAQVFESEVVRFDGVRRHVIISKSPFPVEGEKDKDGIIGVLVDITERKRNEILLQEMSLMDELTGLNNRRSFNQQLGNQWSIALRNGLALGLIMLDVDFFKRFNDYYGHQAGDECLKTVSAALKHCAKRGGDFVARYGGEEFAVILSGTDQAGAMVVAERIRRQIEELHIPHAPSGLGAYVTVSLGVFSLNPSAALSVEDLIIRADKALYRAKNSGRNCVAVYSDQWDTEAAGK